MNRTIKEKQEVEIKKLHAIILKQSEEAQYFKKCAIDKLSRLDKASRGKIDRLELQLQQAMSDRGKAYDELGWVYT